MTAIDQLTVRLSAALGRGAAYADLAEALRELILDGQLVVGERLPAERTLARVLGLSRTTITAALTLLRAEGYLHSRQGSGTTVSIPPDRTERPDEDARPDVDVDIDLTVATLPAPNQLLAATERALTRLPALLSGHGLHPLGLAELRIALAHRMTGAGLSTRPDQVLITQGALHGWNLVLRSYLRPGEQVLVEQPSYPAALDAVRAHHGRPQVLGVDAGGWRWPQRPTRPVSLAYLMPDHHNPTGHLAEHSARRDLVRRTRGMPLCVDETFAELGYDEQLVSTAALAGHVVVLGGLSKPVWAGLRLGWIRASHDVITRLARARSHQDLATPVIDQLVALELLADLDAICATRRATLRRRRDHAVSLIEGAGWRTVSPRGGMSLWIDLGDTSSTHLAHAARREGVRITPGPRFTAAGTHDKYFRMPYTHPEVTLTRAVARLATAATRLPTAVTEDADRWTV